MFIPLTCNTCHVTQPSVLFSSRTVLFSRELPYGPCCACLLAQMTMNELCVFTDLSLSFSSLPPTPIPHFLPLFFPLFVFVTGSYSLHQSTFQMGNYTYVLLSTCGRL